MSAPVFDVFVVGPVAPGGEAQLIETLAAQSGQPAAALGRALAEKKLRVGNGVARDVAEVIAHQMQAMGARTAITPSAPRGAAATPVQGVGAPVTAKGQGPAAGLPVAAPPGSAAARLTLAPLGGTGFTASRPAPASAPALRPLTLGSTAPAPAATSPPPSSRPVHETPGLPVPVVTQDSPSQSYDVPSSISSFALPATPAEPADPFGVPEAAETPLELSRATAPPKRSLTLPGASGLNTDKILASDSSSGLALSDLTNGGNMERCRTHQLIYDPRKSKGCRKCQEARRTAPPERRTNTTAPKHGLRNEPGKRALLGLALGLGLGFVPAVYYATQPGATEIVRLRAEQGELSQRAGTEEVLTRFDQIEAQVARSHNRLMAGTLAIWLITGGVVLVGFYRVT
jgi:hypothetical protein